jgi:signal peptidase I
MFRFNKMPDDVNKPIKKKGVFREYVEAIALAVIVALFVRSFIVEAFKIPSGSMIPTLSIGDHIFVNKFVYGLRIPFTKKRIVEFGEPKRGDVIVFIYPEDEGKDFIKRVVGLPGDKIRVEGTDLWINGEKVRRHELVAAPYPDDVRRLIVKNSTERVIPFVRGWRDFDFYDELLGQTDHIVQYEKYLDRGPFEIEVPPDNYFVMGDNRDNSADSREWGFVPEGNIKGKAMFVWLSVDKDHGGVRWHEFGRWIE